jgi:hypothetical protein
MENIIMKLFTYNLIILFASISISAQFLGGNGGGSSSAEGPNQAMPVELTSFNINVNQGAVYLSWTTATEIDNYGFDVERQYQDEWKTIGFVQGAGNSYSPKEYEFIDNDKITGSVIYRLKQIDNDGSYSYSSQVEVELGIPTRNELEQNFPNPFNPSTNIRFSINKEAFVKLSIYNAIGELVSILVNEEKDAGIYTVNFNGSDLGSGIYFYKLEAGGFVQTSKMLLLK